MISPHADSVFCRVQLPSGAARHAAVDGAVLRVLDAAPWAGGRPTGQTLPLPGARLLAPSEPKNILCLANAYAGKEKDPSKTIRWFAKTASAAAADHDAVELPDIVDQLKSEVEVVVVVGARLKHATESDAHAAIFGYTVGNEIFGFPEAFKRRWGEDIDRPEPMLAAGLKLGDKFSPFGPFIHRGTAWPQARRTLRINNPRTGKSLEYQGTTQGFLYSPEQTLAQLSRVLTLEPGDVVFTGSTAALLLDRGDSVVAEIEGLGTLHNTIV